jgi:SET family sugar efflux transporter-like MFS transporter
MRRLLVPSTVLLWGLQFAFLNPALALLLVALFHASDAEVGLALALYNAGGFAAALLLPAYADRARNYLAPMMVCSALTVVVCAALFFITSLPVAVVVLTALGGPATVGSTLLVAQLRASGMPLSQQLNTRALYSFAWVAGPPIAALLIAGFGSRSILVAIAVIALLALATTAALRRHRRSGPQSGEATATSRAEIPLPRRALGVVIGAFVALLATNHVGVVLMTLYATRTLGLDVGWGGIALATAALLEIPALVWIGRLTRRFSSLRLIAVGCVVGTAYYLAMALLSGPVLLIAAQLLNAWFVALVLGVGMTYFQQIIRRPGFASGLFANTARVGAVLAGAVIALGSATPFGYRGVFVVSAALSVLALGALLIVRQIGRKSPGGTGSPSLALARA